MKVIEGEGFELKAEKKKVKAKIVMIDPDLALLVLRFLERPAAGTREDKREQHLEQTQEIQ